MPITWILWLGWKRKLLWHQTWTRKIDKYSRACTLFTRKNDKRTDTQIQSAWFMYLELIHLTRKRSRHFSLSNTRSGAKRRQKLRQQIPDPTIRMWSIDRCTEGRWRDREELEEIILCMISIYKRIFKVGLFSPFIASLVGVFHPFSATTKLGICILCINWKMNFWVNECRPSDSL